jgi:ParB-like chromosome segregation protein Spo0J
MRAKKAPPLLILYQKIDQLKPFARNASKHTRAQIKQIADSIQLFGFVSPILIDKHGPIIAGNGRYEAAKLQGIVQGQSRPFAITDPLDSQSVSSKRTVNVSHRRRKG